MSPDKIEKHVVLHAPLTRVWDAIADSQKFGAWFGVTFDGPFVAGLHVTGKIRPTTVDPEVAKLQAPYEGKAFDFYVETIQTADFLPLASLRGRAGHRLFKRAD